MQGHASPDRACGGDSRARLRNDPGARASGAVAERAAADFLVARGLERVDANWHRRFGEIDLVMREPADGTIVFVEVRCRGRGGLDDALESVDSGKRARLRRAALAWLQRHADPDHPARIDVVAMTPAGGGSGGGTGDGSGAGSSDGPDDGSGAGRGGEPTGGNPGELRVERHGGFLLAWIVDAIGDD